MSGPTTTLDERYSEAGTNPPPWEETRRVLETAEMFWVTTVRPDGRPHSTPLVAVWLDGALHFSTGPAEQKAVNLRTNPQVLLTTGRDEWDRGLDVMVEGKAVRVVDEKRLARLAEAWTGKWDGRWQFQVRDGAFHHSHGAAAVYAVAPQKVLAFGRVPFTHTVYRFGPE